MATVTKSIGAAKDYATVTLWEADSYGATGADDAVGEVYGTVTESGAVTINDTTPLTVTLQSNSGERHDGTKGFGAKIALANTGNQLLISGDFGTFSFLWLEADSGGFNNVYTVYKTGGGTFNFKNNLLYNASSNRSGVQVTGLFLSGANPAVFNIENNAIFDIANAGTQNTYGIYNTGNAEFNQYNNTIYNISNTNGGAGDAYGLNYTDQASTTLKNNAITSISSTAGAAACYNDSSPVNAATATNGSDDATSPDGAAYRALTFSFTDAANGDFNLGAGSSANVLSGGTDLGATANIDLSGRDRDAEGDSWSLGALQYVAVAGGRIMSSLVNAGGLVGCGGLTGVGGGLAG